MKSKRQRWKNSAQQSPRWLLQNDIIFSYNCRGNHWETIDETGVSERLNRSETPLSKWISTPRKASETAPFWSHWSFTRRYQWKRKRLERSCFHGETSLETFEQSVLERSTASTPFLHRRFKRFNMKRNLAWRFRPCFFVFVLDVGIYFLVKKVLKMIFKRFRQKQRIVSVRPSVFGSHFLSGGVATSVFVPGTRYAGPTSTLLVPYRALDEFQQCSNSRGLRFSAFCAFICTSIDRVLVPVPGTW